MTEPTATATLAGSPTEAGVDAVMAAAPASFDVETYIKNAPRRTPRFTEADLRIIADHAYAQGYQDAVDANG